MPRNPGKRRCSRPGCRAWARRGGELCRAHAPRDPARGEAPLPTLESEIRLLAGRRDDLDGVLKKRIGDDLETGEALRYLATLSQVGRTLFMMLLQRAAATGAADLERFFGAVSKRVYELAAGEGENHRDTEGAPPDEEQR